MIDWLGGFIWRLYCHVDCMIRMRSYNTMIENLYTNINLNVGIVFRKSMSGDMFEI